MSGLTKAYAQKTVLDIESLDIEKGSITALLGPNGAGKTTLLSILAFLTSPTSGKLRYRDLNVRFAESALQPLRKEVVLISQNPIMFSKSVYKNMEFGLKIRGIKPEKRKEKILKNLELVGMESLVNARAHRLSGGETQRIAIARALALSPKVILCDEPLANVDSQNQAVIINLLAQINQGKGISIIFTSHDALWAKNLADNTIFLDNGKPSALALENIFSGMMEKDAQGNSVCVLGPDVRIAVPGSVSGRVRVSIDPARIQLLTGPKPGLHSISGIISQLGGEKAGVRVIVNAKIPITVLLSHELYEKLRPKINDKVWLNIPKKFIRVLTS